MMTSDPKHSVVQSVEFGIRVSNLRTHIFSLELAACAGKQNLKRKKQAMVDFSKRCEVLQEEYLET